MDGFTIKVNVYFFLFKGEEIHCFFTSVAALVATKEIMPTHTLIFQLQRNTKHQQFNKYVCDCYPFPTHGKQVGNVSVKFYVN